jgi:uncharacterized protein YgbK (DUF1537 family)
MPHLVLIADDFTGANDSGVQFAHSMGPTSVYYDDEALSISDSVSVIDTESRHLSCSGAASRVAQATERGKRAGAAWFYKKIDSTLRGNIGCELSAVSSVLRDRIVVIAPAFPQAGRTTKDGICLVHGRPVADTEFADDPLSPVTASRISTVLSGRLEEPAAVVSLELLRSDSVDVQRLVAECGSRVLVFDAETNTDLDRIAGATLPHLSHVLYVGSAGLAAALVRRGIGSRIDSRRAHKVSPTETDGQRVAGVGSESSSKAERETGVLLVVGSAGEVARRQLSRAVRAGVVTALRCVPGHETRSIVSRASELLSKGMNVALCGPEERLPDGADAVSPLLAGVASTIMEEVTPVGVVATGGETGLALCRAIGTTRFRPIDEVQPGVPFGYLYGGRVAIPAVTKAGGFGDGDVFIDSVRRLSG